MAISQNPSHMLETKLFIDKEEQDNLNCCEECASNYEKEAQLFKPGQKKLLPSWLQSHSTEAHHKDELAQLKKKWNRLCQSLHQNKQPQNHWSNSILGNQSSNGKIYPYNSSYPWWPNQGSAIIPNASSISFADSAAAKPAYSSNLVPRFRRQQSCTIEFNFSDVTQNKQSTTTLDSLKGMEEGNNEVKISLALGNSSTFGGSGQTVGKNITTQRQAHICKLLQDNVPWQSETTVASIAEALVDSKSAKQGATWLFLQGNDSVGKTRLARAIAESVFGSADTLLHFDMWKMEKNSATPFSDMLAAALKTNEKLVLFIENVDFADAHFKKSLAEGFETSKFGSLSQAIFILSNGSTRINEEQNNDSVVNLVLQISETKPTLESSHKRRAELDLFTKSKSPRIEEKEEITVLVSEHGNNRKKVFSRQSSFNTDLDLNMKADEEDDGEDISSDLTRETIADPLNSNGSLDSIENHFEFNQSAAKERKMGEVFLWKIKECFEEVFGKEKLGNFTVEERVIEEIGVGCGSFTNSMFEKWLKDIFQSSLQTVKLGGGKGGIVFTLCGGGKEDTAKLDSGFMSSCLPNNIQVNYFMD